MAVVSLHKDIVRNIFKPNALVWFPMNIPGIVVSIYRLAMEGWPWKVGHGRLAMEISNFTDCNLACNESIQLNNGNLCATSPIIIGAGGASHASCKPSWEKSCRS